MKFDKQRYVDYKESVPLLEVGETAKIPIAVESVDEDDTFFETEFKEVRSKNRIAQWGSDAVMLLVTHTQFYLLLFALSLNLRTAWSYQYTSYFSWTFLLQIDYWSWAKVALKSGTDKRPIWPSSTGYALSDEIPLNYRMLSLLSTLVIGMTLFSYLLFRILLRRKSPGDMMMIRSYGYKVFVWTAEVLIIPYGVFALRWWWCRYRGSSIIDRNTVNNATDVFPRVSCYDFSTDNLANIICQLGTTLIFLLWFSVPLDMLLKIKANIFTDVTVEHEGFLLLKETEYIYGLDDGWLLSNYFLQSSHRRPWAYFRVYMFVIKLVVLLIYGSLFDYELYQHLLLTTLFFILSILVLVRRPYRLLSFNLMLFLSFFVNFWNAFIGVCIELNTRNAFTQDQYLKAELILLNGGFYILAAIWLVFLTLRWKKVIKSDKPLWPNLTKSTHFKQDLDEMTRKYLVSTIRAQLLLKETYNTTPLLAPAHELSRRIKILNAYCREAMLYDHVLQYTMWDITDELIQAHTVVYKKSIFSDSSSYGSHESAKQLYAMLPTLAVRLKQRDEDLILMSRKRRRILLKMYTLSVFLSKHLDRVRRELTEAKENKGYETDSDFEDDEQHNNDNQEHPTGHTEKIGRIFDNSFVFDSTTDESNALSPPGGSRDVSRDPYNSSFISTGVADSTFDGDISVLLNNSLFDKGLDNSKISTPVKGIRSERSSSFAGLSQSTLLPPNRPHTSSHNRNSDQVLSFRKT